MIRGIRGATTVSADQPEKILEETKRLIMEMNEKNKIDPENVASVIISTTNDLSSAFPAKAVRSIENWTYVPIMGTREMDVPGGLPLCIRVMMHVNTEVSQKEIEHVYLNDAIKLRPDLVRDSKVSSS